MQREFYIGQRISFAKTLCTVRYVGPVKGTKGEWLGIEWDDPSKGKHNGNHENVKYFDCQSKAPNPGSFVRPSRHSDPPLGFLEALGKKYAPGDDGGPATEVEIKISGKLVEEVGFDKIREQLAMLPELRIVVLDGLCIAGVQARPWIGSSELRIQDRQRIREQRFKIRELDLSRNLLETWADVAEICSSLKSLHSLKVDGNRFRVLALPPFGKGEEPFPFVKELSLDETLLTWDNIVLLTSTFPSLVTLSLASNALSTIPTPLPNPHLKNLSLAFNLFPSLTSLLPLTDLPGLQSLSLRSNPLTSLSIPTPFLPLNHLDLTSTLLPSSLSALSPLPQTCPQLSSLLTTHTPLSALPAASLLTIARIPTLTALNFSSVSPAERQNAELYYLSLIARELSAAAADAADSDGMTAQVLERHSRYADLCALHGAPAVAAKRPGGLDGEDAADMLEAQIVAFSFYVRSGETVLEKTIDIPRSVDVYALKGIVGRAFGLRPLGCRLVWESGEWDPVAAGVDGGDDGEWTCSEDESEHEHEHEHEKERKEGRGGVGSEKIATEQEAGKWVRREVELVDGTREVGFWIGEKEARVRVEER